MSKQDLDKIYVQKVLNKASAFNLVLLEKICAYLNKTYDFYNIEKHYPDLIELFYLGVDEYEQEPRKYPNCNKTFMRLLTNLSNINDLIKVDYISGPSQIYKLEKDNTIIYLMGEHPHSNINNCTTVKSILDEIKSGRSNIKIHDYFKNLFNNTSVFIDFYVELPVLMKSLLDSQRPIGYHENITLLSDIAPEFINCLGSNKKNCTYNNVRIHSIDSREIDNISDQYKHDSLTIFTNYINSVAYNIRNNQSIPIIFMMFRLFNLDIIKSFSSIKNDTQLKKLIAEIYTSNSLLMKEFNKSLLKRHYTPNQFFYILVNSVTFEKYKPVITFCSKVQNLTITDWLTDKTIDYNFIGKLLIALSATNLDAYCLCRMFKQFKTNGNQPKIPHNIIVYTGSGHSAEIYKFLVNSIYKFHLTEYSNINTDACLKMTNIKQPLFDRPNLKSYIEK